MVFVTQNDMGGLGQGIQQIGSALGQALQKRGENKRFQDIFNPQSQQPQQQNVGEDEGFRTKFLDMLQNYENESGELLEPKQVDFLWNNAVSSAQQPSPEAGQPRQYTERQLAEIGRTNPQLASMLQQSQLAKAKMSQKEELETSKRAFEENKPFVEQMNKIRDGVATKEINLFRINEALDSGNVRTWRNFMADYFDNEFIRSAEGAELLSATKEEFLSDMQQMPSGTRLNQYLEKNMREALQTIGKSVESNRIITRFQEFKHDINKEKLKIYDNTRNRYLDKGLEPPRNLQYMVDDKLKEYTNKKQKEFTKDVKDIRDGKIKSSGGLALEEARKRVKELPSEPGSVWMMAPDGNIYPIPQNQVKHMQSQEGGVILR